jgi:hypothetical protein
MMRSFEKGSLPSYTLLQPSKIINCVSLPESVIATFPSLSSEPSEPVEVKSNEHIFTPTKNSDKAVHGFIKLQYITNGGVIRKPGIGSTRVEYDFSCARKHKRTVHHRSEGYIVDPAKERCI